MSHRNVHAAAALAVALILALTGPIPLDAQGLLDGPARGGGAAKGRASWKVTVEPKEVKPGERAEVVAEYTVEPGWWIYAPDHKADSGIATAVRIESPAIEAGGAPTFPAPEVKREPVLNETHRILKKTGIIRQPFTVKKDAAPGELKFKVMAEYMACNDDGCDLPKKPSFEVAVKVSDAPPAEAVPAPEKAAAPAAKQDGRVTWKVTVEPGEVPRGGKAEVVAEYTVPDGWWIYAPDHDAVPEQATKVAVESPSVESSGKPTFPAPEVKQVPVLNETHRILKKTGAIRQPFTVKEDAAPGGLTLKVAAHYVACNEEMCDLPKNPAFEVVVKVTDAPAAAAGDEDIAGMPLLSLVLVMIGGALLTLVMPCTYPMIPITISYFTKQSEARAGNVAGLALAYGFGIILIFNVIGWLFAGTIGKFAADPVLNLVFGIAFVIFALALFGIIELRLPASVTTFAAKSGGAGGFLGVFLLGAVLVITSFTCTAPILGSVLAVAAKGQSLGRVTLGMTVFGATVATPFVLLSLFPARVRSLPRAGEWMHVIKVSLGFVELVAALKFFSNSDLQWNWQVLPRELFLLLWAATFIVLGLYLLSVFRMRDEEARGISGIRMLLGLAAISLALYFAFGALGYKLDRITESLAPPYHAEVHGNAKGPAGRGGKESGIAWTIVEDDLEAGLAKAREEGKRALINFTGKV
jgi:thiol:disulfide interchange protein DsbD